MLIYGILTGITIKSCYFSCNPIFSLLLHIPALIFTYLIYIARICRLERRWIEVTADTQVDALLNAVRYGLNSDVHDAKDVPRSTMVFTNTVDAANSVSDILQRVGIPCILYHRESSLEERANNLQSFRENGGVLVCTDAAARGLDVPNVSHVIQVSSTSSFSVNT